MRKRLALILLCGALSLVGCNSALADPTPSFADACGGANNLDYAVCERVDYLAQGQAANDNTFQLIWWGVWIDGGLLTLLIVQPYWDRLFNWWRNPT